MEINESETKVVLLEENLHNFINNLSEIVKSIHSENELSKVLEEYIFGNKNLLQKDGLNFKAKMGYLSKITRDLDEYFPPRFLPESLPNDYQLKKVLNDYFESKKIETGIIPLPDGKLYKHMFRNRDIPLEPYLCIDYKNDGNIHEEIKEKITFDVGQVLYIPLFGRWHQLYVLMLEFELGTDRTDDLLRNTNAILSSHISHSINSAYLSVLNMNNITGKIADHIFRLWKDKLDTHVEVIYHSNRVAQISTILVEDSNLGIDKKDRPFITLAALIHNWGKTRSTYMMAEEAEDDSKDLKELKENYDKIEKLTGDAKNKAIKKILKKSETETHLKNIILRKKEFNLWQEEYDKHPIYSAEDILESEFYKSNQAGPWWWLLPVICHHEYTREGKLAGDKSQINVSASVQAFLKKLFHPDTPVCNTISDIINHVKTKNMTWKRAIDIVAIADDIDGDVSPSSYRPRTKFGPRTKIQKLTTSSKDKDLSPYNDEIIESIKRNRGSILSVYSAPVNLANI